ncbi:methylated-DNA--[protein]-cysteine S-methyltransferase [Paucisalibacillus sp. EB02]|uniref:methylated-DNA--[protein]-cysteine S-methyltransferase n=1 Tax=Paucisalibacillus sp. EB02 TaxID=1347087 RepID=UPI0005A89942|nr:methylated-DNA--[protein]-cysteine S-methyltransferase [Paucisalibacillus sp. EB02]
MYLYYGEIETPIGILLAISDGEKIVRIDYGAYADNQEKLIKWTKRYFKEWQAIHVPEKVTQVEKQLQEYFRKERLVFEFGYSFYGTDFQKKVWQVLLNELPFGKSKSYKDIAVAIGNPKAVRAVGGAVNKNPFSIVVPCHRVVGESGKLVGYNGGLDRKEYLLKHEEILL